MTEETEAKQEKTNWWFTQGEENFKKQKTGVKFSKTRENTAIMREEGQIKRNSHKNKKDLLEINTMAKMK